MVGDPGVRRRPLLRGAGSAGVAGLGVAAGCLSWRGSRQNRSLGSPHETVRLEYLDVAGDRTRSLFDPVVRRLDERYDPTIELDVTHVAYPKLRAELLTRLRNGNVPDVAGLDQIWLASFADRGALLSLDNVASDIGFADYLDPFARPAQVDGSVYGIPISTDVRGMYWNRSVLSDAGLDPDAPPRTWAELRRMADTVHDPPDTYGVAHLPSPSRWAVDLFAADGQFLADDGTTPTFHREPGRRAASFLADAVTEFGSPSLPRTGVDLSREFLRGKYAFNVVEGSWLDYFWQQLGHERSALPESFGFAPTPTPRGHDVVTMSGGFLWTGFTGTDYPMLVRDFLRLAGTQWFKKRVAVQTASIPTRSSLLVVGVPDLWRNLLYDDTIRTLLDDTRTRPARHWRTIAAELEPALRSVASGDSAPDSAVDRAAAVVDDRLG